MCTLAVCLRTRSDLPLIVAANRDESLTRPAQPPLRWTPPGAPAFIAGRDDFGGGTWMGLNAEGLFVGLTNLWWKDFRTPRPRSRGQLVTDLLAARDLDEARQRLREQPVTEMGPFNLVCATTHGEGFVAASADTLDITPLAAGVHVISNLLPHTPWAKTERVHKALTEVITTPAAQLPNALAVILSAHTDGGSPTESVCVHTENAYGTISSAILLCPPDPAAAILRYADGPPCRTPFTDNSTLMASLR